MSGCYCVGATLVFDVELVSMKCFVCFIKLICILVVVIMVNLTLNVVIIVALALFIATSCLFTSDRPNTISYVFRFGIDCSHQFNTISYDISPVKLSRVNTVQRKRIVHSMCFSDSKIEF